MRQVRRLFAVLVLCCAAFYGGQPVAAALDQEGVEEGTGPAGHPPRKASEEGAPSWRRQGAACQPMGIQQVGDVPRRFRAAPREECEIEMQAGVGSGAVGKSH